MSLELFMAVMKGNTALTAELLAAGADPNAHKTSLWTHYMKVVDEHPELVSNHLSREHTDPNPLVIWTWTPLMLACAQKHWDIAFLLLDAGAEADVYDEQNQTPLMFAIRNAQPALVRRLLEDGAAPDRTIEQGFTPLMAAAIVEVRDFSLSTFRLLHTRPSRAPAPIEHQDAFAEIVQALLAHGADVNAVAEKGDTALIYAAARGWTEGVRLLLDAGAEIHCEAEQLGTPLFASLPLYPETARLLLERGADIAFVSSTLGAPMKRSIGYRPNGLGRSPQRKDAIPDDGKLATFLHNMPTPGEHTSDAEDITALTLLLDFGADPDQTLPREYATPLISAAGRDAIDALHLLLARGADINGRDIQGNTPLLAAVQSRRVRAVQALLEHGADHTLRNLEGITALMAASLPTWQEHKLQRLNTMSDTPTEAELEERRQKFQALMQSIAPQDAQKLNTTITGKVSPEVRAGEKDFLERTVAEQATGQQRIIHLLQGAGAKE